MDVEAALARFEAIAPGFLTAFKPNSCIEVTRFMKEVFAHLGIDVEAVPTKLSVHCPSLKYQYVTGLTSEERASGMKKAQNWSEAEPWGSGLNGHVVGIVAGRFWVDCTLAQASCPEKGFVIAPGVLIVPLPEKLPPVTSMLLQAKITVEELSVEVKWWGSDNRSFEATEAWERSHLVDPARLVAREISSAAVPAAIPAATART